MRQIVLDTETTGLEPGEGHRIIEIGCIELRNRRMTRESFHCYLNPGRDIDRAAVDVHGITDEFLADQPPFGDVVDRLIEFVHGAELLIHNAAFDTEFLDRELGRLEGYGRITDHCAVVDTLELARKLHPGQRNSLDALCARYNVDSSGREVHGALVDARLLAEVYLAMTGGQVTLSLERAAESGSAELALRRIDRTGLVLAVVRATAAEEAAHRARVEAVDAASGGRCVYRRLAAEHPAAEARSA